MPLLTAQGVNLMDHTFLDGSVGTWLLWKHNKNMRFVKNEHFSYSLGVIKSEIYHAGWFEVVT